MTRVRASTVQRLLVQRGLRCARCGDPTVNHTCGRCGVVWVEAAGWVQDGPAQPETTHPVVALEGP